MGPQLPNSGPSSASGAPECCDRSDLVPVLVIAGAKAVVLTLEIMAGISVLIWTTTFALFSLVTLPLIFWTPVSTVKRSAAVDLTNETGVADRWLDRPA